MRVSPLCTLPDSILPITTVPISLNLSINGILQTCHSARICHAVENWRKCRLTECANMTKRKKATLREKEESHV
jgi:hypothetical protein